MNEVGYSIGQNVAVEIRTTDRNDGLPELAAELVRRPVALIFATGNTNAARAAKAATTTIPIVFSNGGDPVKLGLVASMNRPGGKVTGVDDYTSALVAKRLEMLREIAPPAAVIGFLTNPTNLVSDTGAADLHAAAGAIEQRFIVLRASTPDEIDLAFATAAQQRVGALSTPSLSADTIRLSRSRLIIGSRRAMEIAYSQWPAV